MKERTIIAYALAPYKERLKPFLFWMIVAATTMSVTAIVVGCDLSAVDNLMIHLRHYFR